MNKIPNDRLETVIRAMIKDLEKRKDKAMKRLDTDDLWIEIESLQWVLFVIFAIKNGTYGCSLNPSFNKFKITTSIYCNTNLCQKL